MDPVIRLLEVFAVLGLGLGVSLLALGPVRTLHGRTIRMRLLPLGGRIQVAYDARITALSTDGNARIMIGRPGPIYGAYELPDNSLRSGEFWIVEGWIKRIELDSLLPNTVKVYLSYRQRVIALALICVALYVPLRLITG